MAPTTASSNSGSSKKSATKRGSGGGGGSSKKEGNNNDRKKNCLSRSPKKDGVSISAMSRANLIHSVVCKNSVVVYIPVKASNGGAEDQPYMSNLRRIAYDEEKKLELDIDAVGQRRVTHPRDGDEGMLTTRGYPYQLIIKVFPNQEEVTPANVSRIGRGLASHFSNHSKDNDTYHALFRYIGDRTVLNDDGTFPAPGQLMRNADAMLIMNALFPVDVFTPEQRVNNLCWDFFDCETEEIRNLIASGVELEFNPGDN